MNASWSSRVKSWTLVLAVACLTVGCGGASYSEAEEPTANAKTLKQEVRDFSYPREDVCSVDPTACPSLDMEGLFDEKRRPGLAFRSAAPPVAKKSRSFLQKTEPGSDDGLDDATVVEPAEDAALQAANHAAQNDVEPKQQRVLIYSAYLRMAVFRTEEKVAAIHALAKKNGGYVVKRDGRTVTFRVPAEDFEDFVAKVVGLGDVRSRKLKVRDVTAEYRDLGIRLRNALALRERLTVLLEQAESVEAVLEVERELARVSETIERIKGKLALMNELVAYSTVTVEFAEKAEKVKPNVWLPFPWLDNLGVHRLLNLRGGY